ncbi:hypothetical protein AeMF1_012293 [Aphanomyces euteiches]|nr:hypothetical protein AeMF1_012293 [Aphanomyces euteiches]KAH9185563.1 hypothetical protein AeNC1_012462 [Aphanomyces euteiches]
MAEENTVNASAGASFARHVKDTLLDESRPVDIQVGVQQPNHSEAPVVTSSDSRDTPEARPMVHSDAHGANNENDQGGVTINELKAVSNDTDKSISRMIKVVDSLSAHLSSIASMKSDLEKVKETNIRQLDELLAARAASKTLKLEKAAADIMLKAAPGIVNSRA